MRYKIMAEVVGDIATNLSNIRSRIADAVKNRPTSLPQREPTLVAVSKTKTLVAVKKAYDAGQRHFGENYLKELVAKSTNPDIAIMCPDIKWHYIGTFQKKMATILLRVTNLHMLETLSAPDHADGVNSRWRSSEALRVLIQINTSSEASKSGCEPSKCVELARHIRENCPNLRLAGVMAIGAPGHDYTTGPNPDFEKLSECRRNICSALNIKESEMELSMGMSADFEEAIKAGSTVVRVGSSIFGPRDYPEQQSNN